MTDIVEKIKKELYRSGAIDLTYDLIDDELLAHNFENAGAMIEDIAKSDLPLCILLSAQIIARPWKEKLGDKYLELENKIPKAFRFKDV
jgi:hypothetical protein